MYAAPPSPSSRTGWPGRGRNIVLILSGIICILCMIWNFWATISILSIVVALVQIDRFRYLLFFYMDALLKILHLHTGKIVKGTRWGAKKAVERGHVAILLVLMIFFLRDFVLPAGVFQSMQKQIAYTLCIQWQAISCGNGMGMTAVQIKGTLVNIGLLEPEGRPTPFNQLDMYNNNSEAYVEGRIAQENAAIGNGKYLSIIVATTLSQTLSDLGVSSTAGLDDLRGAYMAQYNYNHDPDNRDKPKLRLLIANFGVKDAAANTAPQVMDRIKQYASANPQSFIGVVGFPFSNLVRFTLAERAKISGYDIPIITSAAEASQFTDDGKPPALPDFYKNFLSIVPPTSDDALVIYQFMEEHLSLSQKKIAVFYDPGDTYSSDLSTQFIQARRGNVTLESYRVGDPESLEPGIQDIVHQASDYVFFAGYANDFNTFRARLKENSQTQNMQIIGGEGLYYPYPSVYDNSGNTYNYANLFFTTDAAYAQVDTYAQTVQRDLRATPLFNLIPVSHCPDGVLQAQGGASTNQEIAPFNLEFCSWFYQRNSPGAYGYLHPGFHTVLTFDATNLVLNAWNKTNPPSSPALQGVDENLRDTPFEGVSGYIAFSTDDSARFHPADDANSSKPIYVACTGSTGETYIVAVYHVTQGTVVMDSFSQPEQGKCLKA